MSYTVDSFVTALERDLYNVANKTPHEFERSLKSVERLRKCIRDLAMLFQPVAVKEPANDVITKPSHKATSEKEMK